MSLVTTSNLALDLYRKTSHVIGQERARRSLAMLLERQRAVADGKLDRAAAALIAGRTGTGKTMLTRAMCNLCGLPFAEVNATQYTERGYVGQDLPQMYLPLLNAAARILDARHGRVSMSDEGVLTRDVADDAVLKRKDLDKIKELAQVGVVLMDEGDKWLQRYNHVTGRMDTAIQTELLKQIEGDTEWVSDNQDEIGTPFETHRVLHLFCGAFVDLPKVVSKRLNLKLDAQYNDETFWELIQPIDFMRMGIIPELAGRLATHVFLRPLRVEHLHRIMTAPGGLLDEYKLRFQQLGVAWDVPEEAIQSLSADALERGTGARALDHLMAARFLEALFTAAEMEVPSRVTLKVNHSKASVVAA